MPTSKAPNNIELSPNAWLKEMAKLSPSKWNFRRSSRAALAIMLPLLIGYFSGTLAITMWISMGAMFPSIGERDAPYSFTIRKILISAPIGAAGFLMGYLGLWIEDWSVIVLIMSVVAFICAIASSYSATVSIGCLQFMAMSAVSLGTPEIATFWKSSALLLCGTAVYLLLILLERWLFPHQLRKNAILEVLKSLIQICEQKIAGRELEDARLAYTIKYQALYTMMLQRRFQALGYNHALAQTAEIVQNLDNLFVALMGSPHLDEVKTLKIHLTHIAQALSDDAPSPELEQDSNDFRLVLNDLTLALWSNKKIFVNPSKQKNRFSVQIILQKLNPGRAAVQNAAALALCTALAYSVYWFDNVAHWYWVPMTVAIVMKPELGSIFVRAVQRTVGTAAGVMVGGIILGLLPVGVFFIAVIGLIAFILPWLSPRNYALTAFAITPLVLVLIDLIAPAHNVFDYAAVRLVDTFIGCAIVLLFGYLLWPRYRENELTQTMNNARHAIAQYLVEVLAAPLQPQSRALSQARSDAYGKLVDMRTALQKSLAEPPPAGYEAAAWFPLVACAARLCDAITVYSTSASPQPDSAQWQWLKQVPACIEGLAPLPELPEQGLTETSPESQLIASIRKETHLRESLYERRSSH